MDEKEKLKHLSALLASEGWKILEDHITQAEASALQDIVNAKDPDTRAVTTGFYRALRQMKCWPHNVAVFTKQQLEYKSKEALQFTNEHE